MQARHLERKGKKKEKKRVAQVSLDYRVPTLLDRWDVTLATAQAVR